VKGLRTELGGPDDGVAFGDPAHWVGYTVALSLALGVAGATQDGLRVKTA
jgi:hypothetical protein